MITDCIFDFYGTLVDIHTDEDREELWQTLAEEFAPKGLIASPEELRLSYQQLVDEEENRMSLLHPDGNGEICLDRVFAGLFRDREMSEEDPLVREVGRRFRELSLDHLRPYEGAARLLNSLRESGKRVWLLSNAQRIFTAHEIELAGLADCFDGIYLSSDHGVKKPSPDFFRILLTEREIRPEQAVMIGNDGRCDIGGAKSVGLASVYLRSETSPKEETPDADYCLEYPDMTKLGEILLQ